MGWYDLAIVVPEPSIVTNEETDTDDDITPSSLPNDVSGNVEVFIRHISSHSDSEDSTE